MDAFDGSAPLAPADEPDAVAHWRAQARDLLAELGLPGRHDEHWRRADLRFLVTAASGDVAAQARPVERLAEVGQLRAGTHLCFDRGRFAPELSRIRHDDALRVGRLGAARPADDLPSAALASHRALVGDLRLALLSRAAGADGAQLVVRRGCAPSRPLVLEHVGGRGARGTAWVSHRVCVEPGASATLVEVYDDRSSAESALLGDVTVELGAGSRLLHLRLVAPSHAAQLADTLRVEVGRDAEYVQRTLAAPAGALRSTQALVLRGDGASAELHAGAFARGGSDVDLRLLAEHGADATRSAQTVHLLAARGRATVDSEAAVPPGRRRVRSRQSLRAVLLEPGCDVALRPRLAIRSDDVDSRHGATTSALPQDQLFYLRSRGLDCAQARRLLAWAHLRQVFPASGDQALDSVVQSLLRAALDRVLAEPGGATR